MEIVKLIIDVFKLALSGISAFFSRGKKDNGITISGNENTEISGNEIKGRNVTIKKNKSAKVRDNKWT